MSRETGRLSRFWAELKRRKTDRAVIFYAASAFVMLQLIDILGSALSLPGWVTTFTIILLATGFPVVAIFSWFFDFTPGGIQKTRSLSDKRREVIQAQLRTWKGSTMISVSVIIALILFNIIRSRIESGEIRNSEKTVAVLPFENLSPDEEMPYTPEAITTFISTGLSGISGLYVSPGYRVLEYKGRIKSIPEIAKKLRVAFIVTGSLVKNSNQIIIGVNLIIGKKDKVLWGDNFSIVQETFMDQMKEIPIRIANSMKTVPSPEEEIRLKQKPTLVSAAYLNFLEGASSQENAWSYLSLGNSYLSDVSVSTSFNNAIRSYDKAIKADSLFALAYAKRSITRSLGYRAGHFSLESDMEKCISDASKSLSIDRNLSEGEIAFGFYYYYFKEDLEKALDHFKLAFALDPESWRCRFYMALVLRAGGKWEESQKLMGQVARFNLQDPLVLTNIGISYAFTHNYDSALFYHEKAIEMMPEWTGPYANKIDALLLRDGYTGNARKVLDTALTRTRSNDLNERRILLDIYDRKYNDALRKTEYAGSDDFDDPGKKLLYFAQIYGYLHNPAKSDEYYKSAFEFYSGNLKENKDDSGSLGQLGIAAAGLKKNTTAVEAGEKALSLIARNVFDRSDRMLNLARIYIMTGNKEKALPILEELLGNPSSLSMGLLKLDPVWESLIISPEFMEMTKRISVKQFL